MITTQSNSRVLLLSLLVIFWKFPTIAQDGSGSSGGYDKLNELRRAPFSQIRVSRPVSQDDTASAPDSTSTSPALPAMEEGSDESEEGSPVALASPAEAESSQAKPKEGLLSRFKLKGKRVKTDESAASETAEVIPRSPEAAVAASSSDPPPTPSDMDGGSNRQFSEEVHRLLTPEAAFARFGNPSGQMPSTPILSQPQNVEETPASRSMKQPTPMARVEPAAPRETGTPNESSDTSRTTTDDSSSNNSDGGMLKKFFGGFGGGQKEMGPTEMPPAPQPAVSEAPDAVAPAELTRSEASHDLPIVKAISSPATTSPPGMAATGESPDSAPSTEQEFSDADAIPKPKQNFFQRLIGNNAKSDAEKDKAESPMVIVTEPMPVKTEEPPPADEEGFTILPIGPVAPLESSAAINGASPQLELPSMERDVADRESSGSEAGFLKKLFSSRDESTEEMTTIASQGSGDSSNTSAPIPSISVPFAINGGTSPDADLSSLDSFDPGDQEVLSTRIFVAVSNYDGLQLISPNGKPGTKLSFAQVVEKLSDGVNWSKIRLADGGEGFIPSNDLRPASFDETVAYLRRQ